MARKQQPKAKAPAKKATAKKKAKAKKAKPRAAKPSPRRIVLIDDELGAEPGRNPGYNRDNFLRDVGATPVTWFFHDGYDSFTRSFQSSEAVAFAVTVEKPDVFLVDLMFGHELTLGMDIIEQLRGRFPRVPIAMLTTHQPSDVVSGADGPVVLGDWLRQRGVGQINKGAIFRTGELWSAIEALTPKPAKRKRKEDA